MLLGFESIFPTDKFRIHSRRASQSTYISVLIRVLVILVLILEILYSLYFLPSNHVQLNNAFS